AVRVTWDDGMQARFHAVWLRDHARDEDTLSASNGQRLLTILEQPEKSAVVAAQCVGQDVEIRFAPEDKTVAFPGAWLRQHSYDCDTRAAAGWTATVVERWDNAMQGQLPV